MNRALTAERVRRDVEVVAHAGLDIDTFLGEAVESLQRAVPHVAACLATADPSTQLLTGTRKYGDLHGNDDHDHEWGLVEYGTCEESAFLELARTGRDAAAVHEMTGGQPGRSPRLSGLITPVYGYTDELRAVMRDGSQVWGGMALFRGPDAPPFGAEEVALVGSLSAAFAAGVRAGLLARLASSAPAPVPAGPVVLIVGADDQVRQTSLGAEERLAELVSPRFGAAATGIIASLVGAARRYARGETDVPPRSRVRTRGGMWLVLHATPLTSAGDGPGGDVVITIEEARPPEIVPLVVAAFDLTPRERDVTQLVLQGVDTKEIAATLHVSTYTVQDHLKSVFDKADVRSRRELIARIYFDQYVPRMGSELGPSGWFTAG
ncbi:MAG TPA: helix-turn-helix transcriptional regulator [Nocardioides sp.]|uniref:helix-turn-helix transcriptional regulator n=1 Tax=Nocardioides sp. TaxID=35761 RepID=UPI002D07B920|nr:helix-turn-helix transcriptional regulator [Nocardioides sp.]HQR28008.1 helix-turn-helix transcriptional regulator [Nocardioides sp.]